jgi:hypothetical protein
MENDIKQSNAGMTGGTNGSLGGAKASDLERGFITDSTEPGHDSNELSKDEKPFEGGFVGRPTGWQR